jgi:hypothetical protein
MKALNPVSKKKLGIIKWTIQKLQLHKHNPNRNKIPKYVKISTQTIIKRAMNHINLNKNENPKTKLF